MSDINFCNTKEQLTHLGEVVTGKVDGSPTGADIDTSTLPYTGQVRKTLPALEEEYQADIDNFVQVSDQLIVDKTAEFDTSIANKEVEADAAIDAYRLLSKGPYAAGIELEDKFEYITYNGESYFATNPPYTTTATLPDADANLFAGGYITIASLPDYTDLVFDTLSDAVNSTLLKDGAEVSIKERTDGSGGGGVWDCVPVSSVTPNTYDIVQCVVDPNLALVLRDEDIIDAKKFGLNNFGSDMTALMQYACDKGRDEKKTVLALGWGYPITQLTVECKIAGDQNDSFGNRPTFTSAITSGYAVTLAGGAGQLDHVTVRNTEAGGNGIDCERILKRIGLNEVSAVTTVPGRVNNPGSIGINFGTTSTPGDQPITSTFKNVNSRNYDVPFDFKFYSNSNVYENFYALNTTVGAATESSVGFRTAGRGGVFIKPVCESNFLESYVTLNESEHNTFIQPWSEGTNVQAVSIQGVSNRVINPFGFGWDAESDQPAQYVRAIVGPYSVIEGNRGPVLEQSAFQRSSNNLLQNSEFTNGLGGLNWGLYAVASSAEIFGNKTVSFIHPTAASYNVDHLLSYVDISRYRGKTLTFVAIGQAAAGVTMSVRGIIRNSGGSNLQYGSSQNFSDSEPTTVKVSFNVPEAINDATSIVFRIAISNSTPTVSAGNVALPMVFLGKDVSDMTPRLLTDGESTTYGNLTFEGGGWNTAHPVIGTRHEWYDTNGNKRAKVGVPTSDTDGTIISANPVT